MSEKNRMEERLSELFGKACPSPELDDAVLARVRELRAEEPETGRRVLVTRRVALVGAAGCAVTAGLALALPSVLRRDAGEGSFGLVVAQAAEQGEAVAVEATPDGLMPQEGTYGSYLKLSLNLSVSGAGVASVTYRVTDSPMNPIDRPSVHEPVYEYPAVSLYIDAKGNVETITVDPTADAEGPCRDVNGNIPYLTIDNSDAYWAADETLTLLKAWLDIKESWIPANEEYARREGETEEEQLRRIKELDERAEADRQALQPQIDAAHEAYLESFRAHAATTESFLAWERELYVNAFTCSADSFERARLEATAAFEGGDEQTRRYRITLVDGHEQVLSERFDALLALDDDFSQCLEEELPWHEYPTPTEAQIAADPRLSAPIFQIEDVTEA